MEFNPDSARARFHELGRMRDDILAQSTPLREERDQISHDAKEKVDAMNKEIKAIEEGLFGLDQERAFLSRALGHKTGEPG